MSSDRRITSFRHGLLAKRTVSDLESPENFDEVVQQHMDCFEPEPGVQEGIVEEMCSAYWRMTRIAAIENGMMNHALGATSPHDTYMDRIIDAQNILTGNPSFTILNTCEARYHRLYDRGIKTLKAIDEYRRRKAEKTS